MLNFLEMIEVIHLLLLQLLLDMLLNMIQVYLILDLKDRQLLLHHLCHWHLHRHQLLLQLAQMLLKRVMCNCL
tara:strand:+ start:466 stop:684 length:219 start_codon:yes stop_codon:yes gene_type:complete